MFEKSQLFRIIFSNRKGIRIKDYITACLTAPCQVSFIIYCFQPGALFPVFIQWGSKHRIIQGRRSLQGLCEAGPAGPGCSGCFPVAFLMFILLIIIFKYSFDAAKCESKHFKIGPGCKTRELGIKPEWQIQYLYRLELYEIHNQLSRFPAALAHFAWTNFIKFCSQGRFPRTRSYVGGFFQCGAKHSFFFFSQENSLQEYCFLHVL